MDFPEHDEHVDFESDAQGIDSAHPAQHNEAQAQREQILRQILMPDARMRLGNIRMVRPELADMVEQQLLALAAQGRIQSQLTDEQLRQILSSMQQPKRDFKINRV